jgi:o-succinylbenzoate synthase
VSRRRDELNAVEFFPYSLPLRVPYRWAKGEQLERCGLLARVDLDGAVGWGEMAPPPHEAVDGTARVAEASAIVEGLEPNDDAFLDQVDARGPYMRIRCAIATAWLSARAAREGISLSAYLAAGSEAPATMVPVNGLVTDGDPEGAAETARRLVEEGHRTLKIKCSAARAEDLVRVAAIRDAAPDATLRLDANEAWHPDWAAAHLADFSTFGIDYVEQPIPAGDTAALAAVRKASPVGIAADEAALDEAAIRELLAAEAVDALILKPQRLGGPDRSLTIIRLAAAQGVRCTITNSLETAVGVTTALHIASLHSQPIPDCGFGTSRFFAEDVAPPPAIVDGQMTVPRGPGLGVEPENF